MNYNELLDQLNSLSLAITTMNYDALTIAPRSGAKYRNKAMSILYGEYFNIMTSEETYKILQDNKNSENDIIRLSVKDQLKGLDKIRNIPQKEFVAFENLKADAQQTWEEAKNSKDFSIFESDLQKLVETQKKMLTYRNDGLIPYESCLNDYEEGLRMEHVESFFSTLEKDLVPHIDTIIAAQGQKPAFLTEFVSYQQQDEITQMICEHLGYDESFGYVGHAEHPFSSTFSINDSRITTHYYENDFTSNIFSIIHEIGHSTYNHQVNPEFEGYPLADNMSMSMHESQSRFLENMIGRSKAFWTPLYPKLQNIIPDVLGNVSLDEFILGINYVDRSPIRIEADEVTYPLHIMVRYEIEKKLFNENLSTKNLNLDFANEMKRLLHITPESDSEGVLQDVHWSDASFGYFPTYALGTAYAAQFMHAMEKDLDVTALLIEGNMKPIFAWLKENIHQYSGMFTAQEMLQRVSGEPFNPNYYVKYLVDKYSDLLGIKLA